MAKTAEFPEIFRQLKALLAPYASQLAVTADAPDHYSLSTPAGPNATFFGAARIGKRYVSYHLMPLYVTPVLLDGISTELRRRMQGKSCFNFTALDAQALAELTILTQRGFASYRVAGRLTP